MEYFVLHKKDFEGRTFPANDHGRELYDGRKTFSDLDEAIIFANSVLHEQPVLVKANALSIKGKKEKLKNIKEPCVIAAFFESKYGHTDLGGDFVRASTHEIERCSKTQLEQTLADLAAEEKKPDKLYWGIEFKYLFS